jgi:DNA-binding HxlR family transcriptional regulator
MTRDTLERAWDADRVSDIEVRSSRDSRVEKLADRIPSEIREGISGIDGDVQYAIVVLLAENQTMAFSELREMLDVHQQTLSNALDTLQNGSIVTKREKGNLNDRYRADYVLTSFGERFLVKLFESLGTSTGIVIPHKNYEEHDNIDGAVISQYEKITINEGNRSEKTVDFANLGEVDLSSADV